MRMTKRRSWMAEKVEEVVDVLAPSAPMVKLVSRWKMTKQQPEMEPWKK